MKITKFLRKNLYKILIVIILILFIFLFRKIMLVREGNDGDEFLAVNDFDGVGVLPSAAGAQPLGDMPPSAAGAPPSAAATAAENLKEEREMLEERTKEQNEIQSKIDDAEKQLAALEQNQDNNMDAHENISPQVQSQKFGRATLYIYSGDKNRTVRITSSPADTKNFIDEVETQIGNHFRKISDRCLPPNNQAFTFHPQTCAPLANFPGDKVNGCDAGGNNKYGDKCPSAAQVVCPNPDHTNVATRFALDEKGFRDYTCGDFNDNVALWYSTTKDQRKQITANCCEKKENVMVVGCGFTADSIQNSMDVDSFKDALIKISKEIVHGPSYGSRKSAAGDCNVAYIAADAADKIPPINLLAASHEFLAANEFEDVDPAIAVSAIATDSMANAPVTKEAPPGPGGGDGGPDNMEAPPAPGGGDGGPDGGDGGPPKDDDLKTCIESRASLCGGYWGGGKMFADHCPNLCRWAAARCGKDGTIEVRSNEDVGKSKYKDCKKLISVTIYLDTITTISEFAFLNCISLKTIILKNKNDNNSKLTTIENSAFRGCRSLTNFKIPNSVTKIGNGAFYGCRSLKSITIPENITVIKKSTFYGCHSLKSIIIPSNVKIIENNAFEDCRSLSIVIFSNISNLNSVGNNSFKKTPWFNARFANVRQTNWFVNFKKNYEKRYSNNDKCRRRKLDTNKNGTSIELRISLPGPSFKDCKTLCKANSKVHPKNNKQYGCNTRVYNGQNKQNECLQKCKDANADEWCDYVNDQHNPRKLSSCYFGQKRPGAMRKNIP